MAEISEIRMESARRALTLLRASSLEFAVKMPDGTIQGSLKVVTETTRKAFRKVNNFSVDYAYIPTLKALEPGNEYSWTVGVEKQIAFQKVVSGSAGKIYGSGNFMTTYKDGVVTILRLA